MQLEEPQVLVRVLGPVQIAGTARRVSRARIVESIVYLALHPEGIPKITWATALWPDRVPTRDSLNTEVWQVRRALGVAKSGAPHFPHALSGQLRFAPTVSTDYAILGRLSDSDRPEDLRAALELVRGQPFEGLNEPTWLVLEGYVADAMARIVSSAVDFAEHCFRTGEPADAMWAGRRALLAAPYEERVWRVVLRATHALGNRAGLASVIDEMGKVMELDGDVLRFVSHETRDLYHTLMHRRAGEAGGTSRRSSR